MPSILCCGHEVETVNDGVMLKGRHDGCCGLYCQACAKQFIREGWADLMTGTSTSWDTFTGDSPNELGELTELVRQVRNRCDIYLLLHNLCVAHLIPTIIEDMYEDVQEMVDSYCVVSHG